MASDGDSIRDDALLIKAYDYSINLANTGIAKRIAISTNTLKRREYEVGKTEYHSYMHYNIGDFVRATYDDQIDYEAKIIGINKDKEICTIKYIGYDNHQEVAMRELVPSWGKKARRSQFTKSKEAKLQEKKNVFIPKLNIPPPPPIPPLLNDINEDSENISAMLMAWYMSGYYTGLYQGQKNRKQKMQKN